jgi:hypothetical protein
MSDQNLRKQIIKLAYTNESLRPHLLPILKEAGADWLEQKVKNPDTGNMVKVKTLKSKPKDSSAYKLYQQIAEKQKGEKKDTGKAKFISPRPFEPDYEKRDQEVANHIDKIKKISATKEEKSLLYNTSIAYIRLGHASDSQEADIFRKYWDTKIKGAKGNGEQQVVNALTEYVKGNLKETVKYQSTSHPRLHNFSQGGEFKYITRYALVLMAADQLLGEENRKKFLTELKVPKSYVDLKPPNLGLSRRYEGLKGTDAAQIAHKNNILDGDLQHVKAFRDASPSHGKKQSPAELKRRFLQNTNDPVTKSRVKDMDAQDFMIMLRSIMDEEGE